MKTKSFEIVEWLGKMIAQPLQPDEHIPALSPWGTDVEHEAERFVAPSATLKPYRRVEMYHQQYWWRLLKCMQQNFPTVHRLFGDDPFQNELAVPYLAANPPSDWALCKLGATFPEWLEQHYQGQDRYLVTQAAHIDWAANHAFWVGSLPAIDFSMLPSDERGSAVLTLQPHVHLLSLEGDLLSFREEFLKNPPEYYNSNAFPAITYGIHHFALYRTPSGMVTWKAISHAQLVMLSLFQRGSTIETACSALEEQGGAILEEALSQIPLWFKQWTVMSWFGRS